MEAYDRNRAQFTREQLAPYAGQWAAFSSDGRQLIATAPGLLELDRLVREAGFDPEQVMFETVCLRDVCVGGVQLEI